MSDKNLFSLENFLLYNTIYGYVRDTKFTDFCVKFLSFC